MPSVHLDLLRCRASGGPDTLPEDAVTRSVRLSVRVLAVALIIGGPLLSLTSLPAGASPSLIGAGSSFAGIEFTQWVKDVGAPPYNLNVTYSPLSSGAGRQDFRDKSVDFGVTDIRYNQYDVNPPPDNTFAYIPVTSGGIAIMYNLVSDGFGPATTPINLDPRTLCNMFMGQVGFWDDAAVAADNPGVHLPHTPVTPVMRSDEAGTNWVLEEYCIAWDNDVYVQFADNASHHGINTPDSPTSTWPIIPPIIGSTGSDGVTQSVAAQDSHGYLTAVETGYARQRNFPVASVENDQNVFVQPTDGNVFDALSYATQQQDGTHVLNFKPGDAKAYNPSTYSYMLVPTSGMAADKTAALTAFVNFTLTFGQAEADGLGYSSIGRRLIQFGLDRIHGIAGASAATSDELAAIPADPTPTAGGGGAGGGGGGVGGVSGGAGAGSGGGGSLGGGGSSSLGGGGSAQSPSAAGGSTAGAGTGTSAGLSSSAAGSSSAHSLGTSGGRFIPASSRGGASTGGSGVQTSGALASADPNVTLGSPTGAVAHTGIAADLVIGFGLCLLAIGELGRRAGLRRRAPV